MYRNLTLYKIVIGFTKRVSLSVLVLFVVPELVGAASISSNKNWKITQFVEAGGAGKKPVVLIGAGTGQGLIEGLILKSYRVSEMPGSVKDAYGRIKPVVVETGRLKITSAKPDYAIAEVVTQGSLLSRVVYPKFPGIMAGDEVMRQQVALVKTKIMIPETSLSYFSIFQDPKSTPQTFEISERGEKALEIASRVFAKSKISLLMIEGYTDHNGPSSANQVESYQRALTVRQYLIDELGFSPERLVAVGYGESEIIDNSMVSGYRSNNRRIVLKALNPKYR